MFHLIKFNNNSNRRKYFIYDLFHESHWISVLLLINAIDTDAASTHSQAFSSEIYDAIIIVKFLSAFMY